MPSGPTSTGPVPFDRTLNGVAHERTSARMRGDDFTHCTLQLVLSGHMVVEHGDRVETAGRGDIVRLDRVRLLVEARLSRRDLTPAMALQLAGMSRAVLYSLFEPLGGVSHYIQERRVARLRTLTAQPHLRAAVLKQAAAQAGFASTSHANRSFSNAHGTTPGRLRGERSDDRAART